jgi:hypothetical protein
MSGKDDSGLGKKIEGLEEKLKELERQLQSSFGGKWFKRVDDAPPAATTQKQTSANADGELRMVLMGPPGAGTFSPFSPQHVALFPSCFLF